MTRYLKENVLSILRRGFEKDTNIAISRIAQGYNILTQQILSNPELNVMEIKYENIIDKNQKTKILLQICSFLEIKPGNLENLKTIIKLPTTHI